MLTSFSRSTGERFIEIITTRNAILVDDKIEAAVKGFIVSFLEFETILTKQVNLQVFSRTTVLSKYLQTVKLDLLTASSGERIAEEYAYEATLASDLVN